MEAAWNKDTAHKRFWKRLLNENVDQLLGNPDALRGMRHNHKRVREYQRLFGKTLEERGLNLYQLIAKACGEVWDDEDEEKGGVLAKKCAHADVKENPDAISLDRARQVGLRQGQIQGNELQASDDRRQVLLQEGQGRPCRRRIGGAAGTQEAPS